MNRKLRLAAWAAAIVATPACATMSFEPAEVQAKRAANADLSLEQQSLRAAVDTLEASMARCGVPEPRSFTAMLQTGLRDLVHGRDRADREELTEPALAYLSAKVDASADVTVFVDDIDTTRAALHEVNIAAADLARATRGEGLTIADVREVERAVSEGQRALRVFRGAADAAELDDASRTNVDSALDGLETVLASSSKVADAIGALHAHMSRGIG